VKFGRLISRKSNRLIFQAFGSVIFIF